ncbi:MAG: hypothetical protein ACKVS8_07345 [Phycisphaerales bacterium]
MAQPAQPGALPDPSCEQCGYPLRGILDPTSGATCPECGTRADPAGPWRPVGWPSPLARAFTMSGPLLAVAGALLALGFDRAVRNWLVWPLSLVWLVALGTFAWLWPLGVAKTWAPAREPRLSRRAAVWRVASPALIFNTAAVAGSLIAFFLLL